MQQCIACTCYIGYVITCQKQVKLAVLLYSFGKNNNKQTQDIESKTSIISKS